MDPADTQYFSLKESDDPVCVQFAFDPTTVLSYGMVFLACDGITTSISPATYMHTFIVSGDVGGEPAVQLRRVQYNFKVSDILGSATGKYYLLITINRKDTTSAQYISEPIQVAESWPDTIVFGWSNSRNAYDTIFSQYPTNFNRRLNGDKIYLRNELETTKFDNQNFARKTLYARDRRVYKIVAGFYEGVMDYDVDKLYKINKCDTVTVDGVPMVALEDDFDVQDMDPNYPLKIASYEAVEANPQDSSQFYEKTKLFLMELGAIKGFPYAVDRMQIGNTASPGSEINFNYEYPANAREIFNSTDESSYIGQLTAKLAPFGLTGSFIVESDKLFYENGVNEAYNQAVVRQLMGFVTNYTTTTGLKTLTVQIFQPVGSQCISTVWTAAGARVLDPTVRSTSPSDTFFLTVPTAAAHNMYLYTNELPTEIRITSSSSAPDRLIRGFSGYPPLNLEVLRLKGGSIPTFSIEFLRRSAPKLKTLSVEYFEIDAMDMGSFVRVNPVDYQYFKNVYLRNNSLGSTELDDFYNQFWYNVVFYYSGGGAIDTSLQSPTATPTSLSLTNRNKMILKGYVITT